MYQILRSRCILCEFNSNSLLAPTRFKASQQSWLQQNRLMSKVRAKRPSRMELSPDVAKRRSNIGKEKSRRSIDIIRGPFAGMNRTRAFIPSDEKRPPSKYGQDDGKRKEKQQDFKALKMQRILAHVGYGKRTRVKKDISNITSFDQFPLLPAVQESITLGALPDTTDANPTPIQRLAIPAMLNVGVRNRSKQTTKCQQFLLAAETGSGKTLAYLIPIIDAIKQSEVIDENYDDDNDNDNISNTKLELQDEIDHASAESTFPNFRPKAIILVPTSELVDQVGKLAKALSHQIKFKACLISSAFTPAVIRKRLSSPAGADLLVTTPQLISNIAQSNPVMLSSVTHLVVDEADSLLDRSFEPFTSSIIQRSTPTLRQLVMCSATIPRRIDTYLRKNYPDIMRLTTPNLHAIPRRVQLSVIDVAQNNYFGNKDLACADTIYKIGQSGVDDAEESEENNDDGAGKAQFKRIMVFVNEREQTSKLAEYLQSKGIYAQALNRDADIRQERNMLSLFTDKESLGVIENEDESDEDKKVLQTLKQARRRLANTRVIVVTDIASRGIDTTLVRDVILYDVPHTSIDFIHRLGRVGRMGRRGRGYVLVGNDDRKDIVSEVRHGMYRGQALI